MKHILFFLLIFLPSMLIAQVAKTETSSSDTLKIEPLGDSITRGTEGDTYRNYLKLKLRADAGIEVDFVGQCTNAAASGSVWADYPELYALLEGDVEHDGYGGLRIDQLTDMTYNTRGYPQVTIEQLVQEANADIILLMIGTNDIISQYDLANAPARLDTMIRKILNSTPAHLIVSTITPTPLPISNGRIQTFNAAIPAIVDSFKAQGKNISFIDINAMLGDSDISADFYHPNSQGYEKIGTGWYDAITSFITDVEEGMNDNTPNKYGLLQNYPNPFNPVTTIQYSTPQRSLVSLKVYDVMGNEIATLINEEKEKGDYSLNFNASKLASGMYLYRLEAGSFVQTRKMILLK